jgi:predicted SAM-dependent methyltransferase
MGLFRKKTLASKPNTIQVGGRLHVGCGSEIIPGWCNIDVQKLPGVDLVLDVTRGFRFSDIDYIFAEHFIEHLRFDEGLRFLEDCWRSLADGGVLRISTPNLDWVYVTHYSVDPGQAGNKVSNTFMLNRAFYGWGHQFLYSREMMLEVLAAVGFSDVVECEYGSSDHVDLLGLERHERCEATPEMPDVLIFEATKHEIEIGSGNSRDKILKRAQHEFLEKLDWKVERG